MVVFPAFIKLQNFVTEIYLGPGILLQGSIPILMQTPQIPTAIYLGKEPNLVTLPLPLMFFTVWSGRENFFTVNILCIIKIISRNNMTWSGRITAKFNLQKSFFTPMLN